MILISYFKKLYARYYTALRMKLVLSLNKIGAKSFETYVFITDLISVYILKPKTTNYFAWIAVQSVTGSIISAQQMASMCESQSLGTLQ